MENRVHFRCNLAKYTESRGNEAAAYKAGVDKGFYHTLTTGDDCHWTELTCRDDANGNMAWYVDLFSCPQGDPDAYGGAC